VKHEIILDTKTFKAVVNGTLILWPTLQAVYETCIWHLLIIALVHLLARYKCMSYKKHGQGLCFTPGHCNYVKFTVDCLVPNLVCTNKF